MIAGPDEGDAVTDLLDDAGSLVTEHARRVPGRIRAGGRVEIGVADTAGGEPDENLAGARLGEVDLLHPSGWPNSSSTAARIFTRRS